MMSIPSRGGGVGWLVMNEYSFGGEGKRLACDG